MKVKIQSKLAKAFDGKLADAIQAFSCTRNTSSSYDPVTETYGAASTLVYSGRGVLFGSYQKDLVKPSNYQATDCKATLLQNEVIKNDGAEVEPQINDVWVIEGGNYQIIDYGKDPTESIWMVQLRKV